MRSIILLNVLLFTSSFSTGCLNSGGTPEITLNVEDQSQNVNVENTFTASFIKAIDTETVTNSNFFLASPTQNSNLTQLSTKTLFDYDSCNPAQAIEATIVCANTRQCSLTPNENLQYATTYTLCLTNDISFMPAALYGNITAKSVQFTTEEEPTYSVGGTITGLGGTVVIQNNEANDLSISENGSFSFTTNLANAASYSISVLTQPSGQTCSITNATGSIAGSDIDNITITCVDVIPAPTLSSINVSEGSSLGGTTVTLMGTDFTNTTGVTFGGRATASVTVVNNTTVTAVTPSHNAGLVNIVLTTSSGNATLTSAYSYLETLAYLANRTSNTVTLCSLDADTDQFVDCADSGVGAVFDFPIGLKLSIDQTRLYVANDNGNDVSVCDIDSEDGRISNCTTTGTTFNQPVSIDINSSGTLAYIANEADNQASVCSVNQSDGTFSDCALSGDGAILTVNGTALDNDDQFAYIPDLNSNAVFVCEIGNNGILENCVDSGQGGIFSNAAAIDLNADATKIYVNNGTITRCDINETTGLLSNCADSGFTTGAGLVHFVFNVYDTKIYATRAFFGASFVIMCDVNPNSGVISNCQDAAGDGTATFNGVSGIVIR